MKPDPWKRLAQAARRAPARPAEMPFGFDSRVTAGLRAHRGESEAPPWALLLRGALVCSALIMVLSIAMNYHSLEDRDPGPVAIADSAIQVTMLP